MNSLPRGLKRRGDDSVVVRLTFQAWLFSAFNPQRRREWGAGSKETGYGMDICVKTGL